MPILYEAPMFGTSLDAAERIVANMRESSSNEIRCIDIYVNGDGKPIVVV